MAKTLTGPALIIGGVALLLVAIPGIWLYMVVSATPLHPSSQNVPSTKDPAPSPKWAGAIEQVRQLVRAHVAEKNLPGVSVAAGRGGEIVWAEGFGFADLAKRAPMTPKTRLRLGTASTVLTSAAIGLLLEERRLKLDDAIRPYVPAFPKQQWPVTLRQVLGHVAGVRSDGGDEGPLFSVHCEQPVEALRYFASRPLLFEPGTKFRDSNYDWIIASAAIEAAAGKPFLAFMQERIFDPLGMRDTQPDSAKPDAAAAPAPGQATSYFPRFAANPTYGVDPMRKLDLSCYAGASVFATTPSDMARFGMAINGGKLLQRATVRSLQTPQRLASGEATGYGLGWDLKTVMLAGTPAREAGHDGKLLGGTVSSLMTFPEDGIVVSVMSNISYADTFALATRIAQVFAQQARKSAGQ